jgi:hypothetical protein
MIPTVKIVHDEAPGGFAIINESDFNPEIHKIFEEPAETSQTKTRK